MKALSLLQAVPWRYRRWSPFSSHHSLPSERHISHFEGRPWFQLLLLAIFFWQSMLSCDWANLGQSDMKQGVLIGLLWHHQNQTNGRKIRSRYPRAVFHIRPFGWGGQPELTHKSTKMWCDAKHSVYESARSFSFEWKKSLQICYLDKINKRINKDNLHWRRFARPHYEHKITGSKGSKSTGRMAGGDFHGFQRCSQSRLDRRLSDWDGRTSHTNTTQLADIQAFLLNKFKLQVIQPVCNVYTIISLPTSSKENFWFQSTLL